MLESRIRFFISLKSGEIPIFRTFVAKFPIVVYFSLKIGYFELDDEYNVTVTFTWDVGSYFGIYEKKDL